MPTPKRWGSWLARPRSVRGLLGLAAVLFLVGHGLILTQGGVVDPRSAQRYNLIDHWVSDFAAQRVLGPWLKASFVAFGLALAGFLGQVGHVLADAAYDSDALRKRIRDPRARACIRPNPTRRRKKRYDRRRYKHRNVIERFFCRIRRCRRVATRYEKKAANFAGFVYLAAFITAEN